MTNKRVRVSVQSFILEIISKDMEYFDLSKDGISNIIISTFGFNDNLNSYEKMIDESKIWNFNLNKRNSELFNDMFKYSDEDNESDFFRKLFFNYINLHPFIREKIIKSDTFNAIENAIQKKRKLKIRYCQKIYDITPISFERDNDCYTLLKAIENNQEIKFEVRYIDVLNVK